MSVDAVNVKDRDLGSCPVIRFDHTATKPLLSSFARLDELREASPVYWNTLGQGFWVVTRYDDVRRAYQSPEIFSSDSQDVLDPNPEQRFIPTHINPPEHAHYRQLLSRWFSPAAIARVVPFAHEVCAREIDRFYPRGECDFVADLALIYPTEVFLSLLNVPTRDAGMFLGWVRTFFAGHGGIDKAPIVEAATAIRGYFADVLADRRRNPRDPDTDLLTALASGRVMDRAIHDDEILDICFILIVAGLDTTQSQMSYLMHRLATDVSCRARLIEDPTLIPAAVEETLRYSSIVQGDGRKLAQDVDFLGCPMKKGEMVFLSVAAANRDPRAFDEPTEFRVDRGPTPHLGFAAGPHRCLGAHLARSEMGIMVEEWHRRIPDYHLGEGSLEERGGGGLSPLTLPLQWSP